MDDLDKRILTEIQTNLPLAEQPFDGLAERMGLAPDDLLARIRRLAEGGRIRRIGPVFDSQRLGYTSTLVAARVPAGRLDEVAEHVNRLPGVTHNYERRGRYNLWFTLTARSREDLDRALDRLRAETGVPQMHSLPAVARYKIRATFDLTGAGEASAVTDISARPAAPEEQHAKPRGGPEDPPRGTGTHPPVRLTEAQKDLVRALQDGLPIQAEPFAPVADAVGRPVAEVIEEVRKWLASGVVRRFGAVIGHRAAGVRAGGLAVFRADPDRLNAAGRALAAHPDVTHCYRRPPLPDFPYTLYAMVHGESEEAVRRRVGEMAAEIDAAAWDALLSGREFKKTPMRYFLDDPTG